MKAHKVALKLNLDAIMEADAWARGKAKEIIKGMNRKIDRIYQISKLVNIVEQN